MGALKIPNSVRVKKLEACPFCAVCGTTKDLELNHFDAKAPATFDNLIVLCSKHHMMWHDVKSKSRHADMVREATKRAKAAGVKFGKKPANYEAIMRIIAENSTQFNPSSRMTEKEVMELAGIKASLYYKCKRMLVEAMRCEKWQYSWQKPRMVRQHPAYPQLLQYNNIQPIPADIAEKLGVKPKEGT